MRLSYIADLSVRREARLAYDRASASLATVGRSATVEPPVTNVLRTGMLSMNPTSSLCAKRSGHR